jgi:hypothetical protein
MQKPMMLLFSRVLAARVLYLIVAGVLLAIVLPAVARAETCPNAQFRTGASANLPDCRAYEMVTPPYKDGYQVVNSTAFETENGLSIIAESLGVFAGSESDSFLGGVYDFARTASGWRTTAVSPPASQFPNGEDPRQPIAPDGSTLWSLERINAKSEGEAGVIYIRKPDGTFVEVGPMRTSSGAGGEVKIIGSSRDLSHVLFRMSVGFWPFDTTAYPYDKSLYEYDRAGESQPALVGVSGGVGSSSLISQCGVSLGTPTMLEGGFNPVSADGSIVFFTPNGADRERCGGAQPPVDELFARVDESQTVAVSEPSLSYCSSSSCTDAEFQGASADGSKAFFTSAQSEEVPGVTDTTNNLYEAELGEVGGEWVRRSVVQVSAGDTSGAGARVQGVSAISEDGSHVYFAAQGVLAPNAGAAVEPGTGLPQHAAAGADNLYLYERDAAYPDGRIVFIAQLSPSDYADWEGAAKENSEYRKQATNNGDFFVFSSVADLTPDDTTTNGERQLFEYDALNGTLVRVSIGQNGFNDDGNNLPEGSTEFAIEGRTLSEDGSYVFFESPGGLTPQALNREEVVGGASSYANNIYEYHNGNVYLISDGRDTSAQRGESLVTLVATDASGADIFFTTSDPLVAQDTDTTSDLYDARIDGGFPAAVSLLPACSGDDCQGKLGASPVLLSPSSEFQAGGNPPLAAFAPAVKAKAKPKAKLKTGPGKCKKSYAKRRGKCVKSRAKKSVRGRR